MSEAAGRFREVLGHFPTGVVVVTAIDRDGEPAGMAVGSFTSVSLDPPLVAFLPAKTSSSYPRIRDAEAFCVNVLASDQEPLCRTFATKGADKFGELGWRPASSGSPILDGVVAWIDCDIEIEHDAGDHFIVVGRVRELDVADTPQPLLFFQGGYGKFTSHSRSAPGQPDLLGHLHLLDAARPEMELLADTLDLECLAVGLVDSEIVILGGAGNQRAGSSLARVGQRSAYAAPLGALFAAHQDEHNIRAWVQRLDPGLSADRRRRYEAMLDRVRRRGWSVVLAGPGQILLERAIGALSPHSPTPVQVRAVHDAARQVDPDDYDPELDDTGSAAVSSISAPVVGPNGDVLLVLSLYGLPNPCAPATLTHFRDTLLQSSAKVSAALGRHTTTVGV